MLQRTLSLFHETAHIDLSHNLCMLTRLLLLSRAKFGEGRMAGEPSCIIECSQYERSLLTFDVVRAACICHHLMYRVERVLACWIIVLAQCPDFPFSVHLSPSPSPLNHRHGGIACSIRYKSQVTSPPNLVRSCACKRTRKDA